MLDHRQSKEWTGNADKIANVADDTSSMRPDTLYFGALHLHFKYISRLNLYLQILNKSSNVYICDY